MKWTILLVFINAFGINGQSFSPKYNFKQLNVQNGLTQNLVYHFLQDSRGYMWIGTHNGLTLFDGAKTINFLHNEQDSTSIGGNFITAILEDSAQQIWIGHETGMDRYNRSDNSFTHFGVDRPDSTNDRTYCVLLGFVSSNNLWFLDTKTRSIRSLNTKNKNTSFVSELDASHAVFYIGSGNTVHVWSSYDKGTIHKVFKNAVLISQQRFFSGKKDLISNPVLEVGHVLQQNDTAVWLSTNEGLVKLNPERNEFLFFNKWQNQEAKEFRFAALSPKGELWVASGPAGIYTFDVNTNQFTANYRNDKLNPFSICSDNIVSAYFDKTGNLWCGSYGNGVSYANTQSSFFSTHISKNETAAWQASNNIHWIGTDTEGSIWCLFADYSGFWVLDKDLKIRSYKLPILENGANFNGAIYKLLFDSGNEVWCATNKGLYIYNAHTNKMRPVKYELINEEVQGSIWIKDIIRLRDQSILFSTYAGLYLITSKEGKHSVTPIRFLDPSDFHGVGALFQDKAGILYVKSLGDFLYILKPNAGTNKYELYKRIAFMPEIYNYFSDAGDSSIYLSTNDGIYHINNTSFKIEKKNLTPKPPFFNISAIFKKENHFWLFGDKGLYFFDEKNNVSRIYTVEDGLPTNEFSLSALVITPDGRCIAGSSNGLVSFYPQVKQDSIYPPIPQLMGIYINDILKTAAPNANEINKINLSHKENTFSFDYSLIAFQHTSSWGFEFKLEGYDEGWVPSGNSRYTRYSKIPPGNYTFYIRATDASGKAASQSKSLEIHIAKAFWQTNFFRIAIALLVLLIAWLLAKWYLQYRITKQKLEFAKLQAIEKERTRIATDMHDDLGAGLSRIKFLSQALSIKDSNDENIKAGLEKITGYSDEMSEKMGEIVWALNEKNDTMADLIAYTRSYAMEYLAAHDIHCEANTPLRLPETFIPGEMRRNIFLTVKECLHNIVKHSLATQVYFAIEINDRLEIIIHDNGKGIDWTKLRPSGNGLQNIRKRMNELDGKAGFFSEKGTKIVLQVPLTL